MPTKISLSLPDRVVAELKKLAEESETTQTDVVRSGISLKEKLERIRKEKGQLLIRYPDGTQERWDPFEL